MKKIILNKKGLILLYSFITLEIVFFACLFILACFSFKFNIFSCLTSLVVSIFIVLYALKIINKNYKKSKNILFYNDEIIKYESCLKEKFLVYINNINEIYYKKEDGLNYLHIKTFSGIYFIVNFPKSYIKKLSKILNREIKYNGLSRKEKRKRRRKELIESFKLFIKEEKFNILFTLTGLALSISFLILYFKNKDNTFLSIFMLSTSFVFSVFEMYYIWVRQKIELNSNILCFFVSVRNIVFLMIVFFIAVLLFSMLLLKLPFSVDFLVIAILLLPSFMIVIGIILLFLMALSYA